ncbi:uncharacterized protein LOC124118285 [Haliotis rufescens]|uniref:uncharacterized protein LOC124118285 n=1 Tax=Haliotis rufescens TaxID=6454 RepID=UPI00201EED87|nr:uncharacterized protein LOC124118285 [Haliotis rufescens]
MTVIPAACACLLLMSLCVWGQDCPPPDSNCQDFESDSDEVQRGYSAISVQAESTLNQVDQAISTGFEDEQNCPIADNLTDFSDRARNTRATLPIQVRPIYGRSCEPCPPKVRYLHRFYRRCYVIFPYRQWIRYVTCPTKCNEPCWCSNTRCVPTRYIRVWVWAWCLGTELPWGYKFGLNWRWLWLPQDCECRELTFHG